MSNTRNTGFLTNVVKYTDKGDISFVSGSTTLMSISSSGAVTVTGVISGSNALTSSYSQNSELLDNLDSTSFVFTSSFNTYSSSMSTRVTNTESTGSTLTTASASFAVVSSSYSSASGSLSTRVTRIEGNYATTGSNVFLGAQTVCANITSTGTIIAQTLNVQQVTSSVVYSSGSNIFGCALTNTQQFTGSVTMTGSLNVAGNTCVVSICSPAYVGGTFSGTTVYGSTAICGGTVSGTTGTFSSTIQANSATLGGIISSKSDGTLGAIRITKDAYNRLTIEDCGSTNMWNIDNKGGTLRIFREDYNATGPGANGSVKLLITNVGIACFSCQVCMPVLLASGCVGIGTTSISSTYGTLTVAGTGISIADDGNAKLQIGRYNSTVCNAYIKMGTNACSLRFTNAADSVDVVVMDKGGNVGIGVTSPTYTLHAGGRGYFFATNQDAGWGMLTLDYGNGDNSNIYAIQMAEGGAVNAAIGYGSYGSSACGDLIFWNNNGSGLNERLRIYPTGIPNFTCQIQIPMYRVSKDSSAYNFTFARFFNSSTLLATLSGADTGTTAVAKVEYVDLYAYAGYEQASGLLLASTRRGGNNTYWCAINNVAAMNTICGGATYPALCWHSGALCLHVGGSNEVTAKISITHYQSTLNICV